MRVQGRRFIYTPVVLILLALLVGLLARSTLRVYRNEELARAKRNEAVLAEQALLSQKAALEERLARLNTPRGVEEAIRTKFQMARPGEELLVIVDERSTTTATSTPSWWKRIWKIF